MSCTNPKPAILIPADTKTGQKIKFLHQFKDAMTYPELRAKYGDMYVEIPCGKCDSCVEQRTKSWAIRCCLEAGQYDDNCFLTLTYSSSCLPYVSKKDIFKFIKRLRNKYGSGIRYYGVFEYGTMSDRPHFHIILFNFFPGDSEIVAPGPFGGFYYKSKELQSLWKFGFVSIGDLSFNSCAYVARYCNKKIKDNGVIHKIPEFSFMSRRPGIGEVYFREHFDSLVNTDKIYAPIEGRYVFSSFRYFDKLIEKIDPNKLQELKDRRISRGELNVASELLSRNISTMEQYLEYQANVIGEKYDRLKRRAV